jgi:Ubiquitin elongating factor core
MTVSAWLWTVDAHREMWLAVAAENGGRGLYLQFCNNLVNDCTYLLDEILKAWRRVLWWTPPKP